MKCATYNLNFRNDDHKTKQKCIAQLAAQGNDVIALQEAKHHSKFLVPGYDAIAYSFDFEHDECLMTLWRKDCGLGKPMHVIAGPIGETTGRLFLLIVFDGVVVINAHCGHRGWQNITELNAAITRAINSKQKGMFAAARSATSHIKPWPKRAVGVALQTSRIVLCCDLNLSLSLPTRTSSKTPQPVPLPQPVLIFDDLHDIYGGRLQRYLFWDGCGVRTCRGSRIDYVFDSLAPPKPPTISGCALSDHSAVSCELQDTCKVVLVLNGVSRDFGKHTKVVYSLAQLRLLQKSKHIVRVHEVYANTPEDIPNTSLIDRFTQLYLSPPYKNCRYIKTQ